MKERSWREEKTQERRLKRIRSRSEEKYGLQRVGDELSDDSSSGASQSVDQSIRHDPIDECEITDRVKIRDFGYLVIHENEGEEGEEVAASEEEEEENTKKGRKSGKREYLIVWP